MMHSIRCISRCQGSTRNLRNTSERYLSAATPAATTHLNGYGPLVLSRNSISMLFIVLLIIEFDF